jgi:CheY-like chemotaxis protein
VILVVEDDVDDLATLVGLWASEGAARVLVLCRSGERALEFMERQKPSRVIVDMGLPGRVQGANVLEAARAHGVHERIAVTRSMLEPVWNHAHASGATRVLVKPLREPRRVVFGEEGA